MRRVCLAIGVSRAEGLAPLRAAATAAEEIGQWAAASGFSRSQDVRVLTDRSHPVTVDLVANAIRELLPMGVQTDAFLLHFAGHGIREDNTRTLWLPTNWRSQLRAIAVERLKNRLSDFGIANVTIISDACKALPNNKDTSDLTPDGVLGLGTSAGTRPIFDRYDAVHDVESAFMIPGSTPGESRCLFSGALVEALWGDKRAIDPHYRDVVTPGSLADYLSLRVAELCRLYDLSCDPQNLPGRPADHLIYFDASKVASASIPKLPPWPKPVRSVITKSGSTPLSATEATWLDAKIRDNLEQVQETSRSVERRNAAIAAFSVNDLPDPSQANLVFQGGAVAAVWAARRVKRRSDRTWRAQIDWGRAEQLVVEYADGVFVPLVVYGSLTTIAARDPRGASGWLLASTYESEQSQRDGAQVLARMQTGDLPASEVDRVAAMLRYSKHGNPVVGAICSYLYDYVGDLQSIRRMAYFYVQRDQPIPYDVALMGELSKGGEQSGDVIDVPHVPARVGTKETRLPDFVTQSTPGAHGLVGGLCPWLRQGWDFVATPTEAEASFVKDLPTVRSHLLPETFTAFSRIGGMALVEHWGFQRWQ